MKLTFEIYHPGERAAGILSYSETVEINVRHGIPEVHHNEFVECMREALASWYDGARILTSEEFNRQISQESQHED